MELLSSGIHDTSKPKRRLQQRVVLKTLLPFTCLVCLDSVSDGYFEPSMHMSVLCVMDRNTQHNSVLVTVYFIWAACLVNVSHRIVWSQLVLVEMVGFV
jgi:hypothetical protein